MSTVTLVTLVVIFAIILTMRRSRRRGPRVTQIDRTVTRDRKDSGDA